MKSNWPIVRLRDVCTKITDGSHRTPRFTANGFPFVTVAHVNNIGLIDFDAANRISQTDYDDLKKNDCKPLPGDVLFSKDGTVGKVSLVDFERDFAVLSSLAILRRNPEVVSQKFLGYALRWDMILSQAAGRKSGSAIKRIVLKELVNIRIPIPPLADQKRLVSILDAAEVLRRLREQADRRTADLIPALFHEMFGDPATNPKGWPRVPIQELTIGKYGIKAGPFGSALKKEFYRTSGYRVYGQEQVIAGDFSIGDYFIDQARFDSLKSCAVCPGDILISLVGTIGRAVVVPEGVAPGIINPRLIKITPNPKMVESVFLVEFLAQTGVQESLKQSAHGGTMDVLNAGILKMIRVPLPPLSHQKHFTARVAGIRAMEATQEDSRRRLNDLFQSLLHRAFRGEL